MRFLLVLNPDSGSGGRADAAALVEEARSRLDDVDVAEVGPGADLERRIRAAAAAGTVVVAAGGDGTVNAVVQHLAGRDVLGVLPLGTLNHFARDLGLRDMDVAFEALRHGVPRPVDLGRVRLDGTGRRFFVNHLGLGVYADSVRERERMDAGKWPALAAASLRVLFRARPLVGEVAADGDARLLDAWILFVGNNRYGTAPGRIGTRERIDEGVLDVRLLRMGARRVLPGKLALGILRSRPWRGKRLVRTEARRVAVELRGPARPVSMDGEVEGPARSLEVEVAPRALRVLQPPS